MKRVLGVLLAAFIGVGALVGIANAQAPANCGVALDLLIDARAKSATSQTAFDTATAADKALADGKVLIADEATAIKIRNEAQAKYDELANVSTDPDNDSALIAQEKVLLAAQTELSKAEEAAKGINIPALTEAAKSDAGSLKTALDKAKVAVVKAQSDANVACQGPSGSPGAPPPPPTDDFDCVDFPLADGTTAQGMLNRTLPEDPHNLDANGNRIACEVVVDDNNNNDNPPPPQQVIQVPVGGVATGDGSSL